MLPYICCCQSHSCFQTATPATNYIVYLLELPLSLYTLLILFQSLV
jgi:hypothetical protein